MNEKIIVYNNIPNKIKSILINGEGWLVGGSINNLINGETPKDYDIVIPNRELFHKILIYLNNEDYKINLNTYGGCKVNLNNIEIDIWCEELSHFLQNANKIEYIFNLKKVILLKLI